MASLSTSQGIDTASSVEVEKAHFARTYSFKLGCLKRNKERGHVLKENCHLNRRWMLSEIPGKGSFLQDFKHVHMLTRSQEGRSGLYGFQMTTLSMDNLQMREIDHLGMELHGCNPFT